MDYGIDTTSEKLNSIGGMAFVGKILEKIGFCKNSEQGTPRHPHVLKSIIGLFTQGRTHFKEMDIVREDSFFKGSLDLTYVPAKETTRLYLENMIPEQAVIDAAREKSTIRLLKSARLTPIAIDYRTYMPVDIDTSPLDNSKSHKEGVSRTYKQFEGYHPIFGYIGQEGYMLTTEVREGKQLKQTQKESVCEKSLMI